MAYRFMCVFESISNFSYQAFEGITIAIEEDEVLSFVDKFIDEYNGEISTIFVIAEYSFEESLKLTHTGVVVVFHAESVALVQQTHKAGEIFSP